ncbi:MAG: type II toxin-antitoxin system HicA family toxin [Vicinamibacterales bacterium]
MGYDPSMTWSEVIRKLKRAGFVQLRSGKGSHLHMVNAKTGQRLVVVYHATQEAGNLGRRLLREAGIK